MRALCFEIADDERIWDFPYQWFLGDDLLVAPVTTEGATSVCLYLPDGEWVDAWTGETLRGRTVIEREAPLDEIPVFVTAARASLFSERTLMEVA